VQRSVRLSLSLNGAAALALAGSPFQPVVDQVEGGSAADLGAMEKAASLTPMSLAPPSPPQSVWATAG